jgi:hypothetical protein
MSNTEALFIAVGILLAVVYGVSAIARLVQVRRLSVLRNRDVSSVREAGADSPAQRFKGEGFETSWQGSKGYAQDGDPTLSENWTDRLIIPVFSPLRPSRFNDRSYWAKYLPGVLLIWTALFVGLPLILFVLVRPTVGAVSSFTPTHAQRAVPGHGSFVDKPTDCPIGTAHDTRDPVVDITYADDSTVFAVPVGGEVVISYIYGRLAFSPTSPLCPDPPKDTAVRAYFVASAPGTGYVYLAQPNRTIVAKIEVNASDAAVLAAFVLLALTVALLDIALTVLVRRAVRDRFS